MIRVIIADDHAIVREGLKQIVADSLDITIVGEASNGPELLEQLNAIPADVVVLDLTMPGRGGLDVLSTIKSTRPALPVLILSMHPADQYAVRVMRAGASGFLNKEAASTDLVNAIHTVADGRKYVSETVAEQLVTFISSPLSLAKHDLLSDREYQVMVKIASGRTITEVAEELSLSVKTVSTYRSRILDKMQLRTNAELTHYVITNGLDTLA